MALRSAPSIKNSVILAAALDALRGNGIDADLGPVGGASQTIKLRYDDRSAAGIVTVRPSLTPANLGLVAHQLAQLDSPLLVTEYVSPQIAEQLKKMNIEFADAAGNAYIRAPSLLIWVTGRKPAQRQRPERVSRAFQPGGLKLIFALLCNPAMASASYRDLAAAADVSLGTVGWVMTDLQETGYLPQTGRKQRNLADRRRLLDRWVEAYSRQLRPKLLIGRFRASMPQGLKNARLPAPGTYWGGESAAARLTSDVQPARTTIYCDDVSRPGIEDRLHLVADADGDIELRRAFWRFEPSGQTGTVPPLLVYADLLAVADSRSLDAARAVYDEYLAPQIDAD